MTVIISGAGIAGLVCALSLAKAGIRVTVIEKAPEILPYGQNIDVEGSALSVIKKLGLLEELRRHHSTEIGTRFVTQSGFAYCTAPRNEGPSITPTSEYEILRGDLAGLLYRTTKKQRSASFRFGTYISAVQENDEKHVKVQLSNGEALTGDVLVIADGQWSRTRSMVFADDLCSMRDLDCFVAYYTIPRDPAIDKRYWDVCPTTRGMTLMTRPDPYDTTRASIMYVPRTKAAKDKWMAASRSDRASQNDLLVSTMRGAGWQSARMVDGLDKTDDFYMHALQQVKLKTWSQGRVVCTGDAAYCATPISGMGCSIAILGGYILAGELSQSSSSDHPRQAFEGYEATFRPFVEKVQDVPYWGPRLLNPNSWWHKLLLEGLLATLGIVARIILSIPPLARRVDPGSEESDDGFPLPNYQTLEKALLLS